MDYFGKMLVYIGFEGRVFGQCHSKWVMSPNFLEVVCTIAVILYYYVDLTPLIDKKKNHAFSFHTLLFSASQTDLTCTFHERSFHALNYPLVEVTV